MHSMSISPLLYITLLAVQSIEFLTESNDGFVVVEAYKVCTLGNPYISDEVWAGNM